MARRLKRFISSVLSVLIVALSAGPGAPRAAAQTISGRAASVSITPQLGLGLSNAPAATTLPALALTAPALPAPAALAPSLPAPVPVVQPAALKPATPAAAIAEKLAAAAPALQALAKPETGGSAASAAGRDLEDVLTGAKSARTTGETEGVAAGVPSALTPTLSAPSTPDASKTPEVPAAAQAPFKTISTASSYRFHRAALKAIAALTGAVFTLPQAGPALSAKVIASAADKQLVLSDFDDTLAGYNEVLPAQKVEAVRRIRAAGKHFAVVSDRSDTKRGTQLTVFESLESIPAAERAGMYVAANSGGKVYRYDEQGVPRLVHEAAALTEAQKALVKEAAEATKARLAEAGAVQHAGDSKNPAESYGPYNYAIMLKPGSSQESVKGVAKILNEELAKRGFEVEVMPRFAKSPENPPYATFSIITKAEAAAYIAKNLGVTAQNALVIGDAMFVPREAKKASRLARLGERLSGRPQAALGNETDRNMTKLLPGVLALGVGKAMDPRVPNGWALDGHGPDVTQKVLESVASKAARPSAPKGDRVGDAIQLGLIGLILGGAALGFYALAHAFAELVRLAGEAIRDWQNSSNGQDGMFLLGATTLGMAGMMSPRRGLTHPNESYVHALKQAVDLAVERGASASDVRFVEATASMPARDGAQWKFTFAIPGGTVYVDFHNFLGGAQDSRSHFYEGPAKNEGVSLTAEQFAAQVRLGAEQALLLAGSRLPGFGAGGASVSLSARAAEDGGKRMAYTFYDGQGSEGTVAGDGAFIRVDKVSEKAAAAAAQEAPAGLTHAVEPNDLFRLALANMRAAAKGEVYLLSAVHEARRFNGAWIGDEWRFHFAVGGKDGGVEYMVPARRTMVSETMMDAFAPKLVGPVSAERMKHDVVPAYLFNKGVVARPDDALRQAPGATRVSLLPRTEPESGDMDLWYSLQKGGEELLAMNARTGEVRRPAPSASPSSVRSPLKDFLVWLGLAGLVAALYGALYWAFTHAGSAAVPQDRGYDVPDGVDPFFQSLGMGGLLGLGALAGTLKVRGDGVDPKAAKAAAEAAAAAGGQAASVRPLQASGTVPALYRKKWNAYVFSFVDAKGRVGLISVQTVNGKGWRASVAEGRGSDGRFQELEAQAFSVGPALDAKSALQRLRKVRPEFGARAGFALAMRRVPGAVVNDLWYCFRDGDGNVGMVNARTGETSWVTDDMVRAWAKGVAAGKGGTWSQTEYNMAYSNSLDSLREKGATDAQLELFKKLCDEAPVLGGGFNRWSGD